MCSCCLLSVRLEVGTVISHCKRIQCNHAELMQHGAGWGIEAHVTDGFEAIDIETAVLGP